MLPGLGPSPIISNDPLYASNVSLLLRGDGSDGSSVAVDNSKYARLMTAVGSAEIDTAQSTFGGSSLHFPAVGSYFSTPDATELRLGAADFTIEGWFRRASGSGSDWTVLTKGTEFALYGDTNRWVFKVSGSNVFVTSWTPTNDTWYHYALVRIGTTTKLYIDGAAINSATSRNVTDAAGAVNVGSINTFAGAREAWIDDLRMTVGVGRYASNFSVPTQPYPL